MDNDNVETKARALVSEMLGVEAEKVTTNSSFVDDLGADSLDAIELTMAFEEEFNVEISDEEAEKLDTFGKAVDYITENQ